MPLVGGFECLELCLYVIREPRTWSGPTSATGRVLLQPSLGGLPGHFQAASSPGQLREHSHPGDISGATQSKTDLIPELLISCRVWFFL